MQTERQGTYKHTVAGFHVSQSICTKSPISPAGVVAALPPGGVGINQRNSLAYTKNQITVGIGNHGHPKQVGKISGQGHGK